MAKLLSLRTERPQDASKLPQGKNSIQMDQIHHPEIHSRIRYHDGPISKKFKGSPYQVIPSSSSDRQQMQTTPAMQIPPQQQDGDLFEFNFRHISAGIVGAGTFKATDFSDERVLRASVPLLSFVKAYKNHNIEVDQEVGFVGEAIWDPRTVSQNGMDIPPGINAPFVIDQILQPEIVRKLNSQRPLIDSASVTVLFLWEPSHEFEFTGDFFWHLGETIDGEMVRRIVTEIVWYDESSLVAFGADPFAKIKNQEGDLQAIDWPNVVQMSKSKANPWLFLSNYVPKFSVFDCYDNQKFIHLSQNNFKSIADAPSQYNDLPMDDELKNSLLAFVAAALGIQADQVKKESLNDLKVIKTTEFDALTKASKQVEDLTGETTRLKAELQISEETKKTALKKYTELEIQNQSSSTSTSLDQETQNLVNQATEILKTSREQVKKLYLKFAGDKKEDTVISEIEASNDMKFLEEKAKKYGLESYNKYGAVCKNCNSTEFDFRKSTGDDVPALLPPENETQQEFFNLAEQALNH